MGDVVKFRRAPRNRGQFRGQGSWRPGKGPGGPKKPKRPDAVSLLLALGGLTPSSNEQANSGGNLRTEPTFST